MILFLGLAIGVWFYLPALFNRDFIVKQIETHFNCRVDVEKIYLNLFNIFSSLEIEGIKVAKRDYYADFGIVLSQRPSIENPEFYIQKVELQFSFLYLVKKKFRVLRFMITEPLLNLDFFGEEGSNFSVFLETPALIEGEENLEFIKNKELRRNSLNSREEEENVVKAPFNIKYTSISAELEQIGIKNALINFMLKKGRMLKFANCDLIIDHINVHPNKLLEHNSLKLNFQFNLHIINNEGMEISQFLFLYNGNIIPFVATTGFINPDTVYNIKVKKGSYVSTRVLLNMLSDVFANLADMGIRLDDTSKQRLQRSSILYIQYEDGRIILQDDLILYATDFDLELKRGSWVRFQDYEHFFDGALIFYKKESSNVVEEFDENLKTVKISKVEIRNRERLLNIFTNKNRIKFPFISKGDITEPKVDADFNLNIGVPSVTDIISELSKVDLMKGVKRLIKTNFGKFF